MSVVALALGVWLMIAAALWRVLARWTRLYPKTMPGGGHAAIVVTAFAWPLIVVFGVLGLLAMFLGALRRC